MGSIYLLRGTPPGGEATLMPSIKNTVREMTVAGEFSGNLSNGGERLLLVDHSRTDHPRFFLS